MNEIKFIGKYKKLLIFAIILIIISIPIIYSANSDTDSVERYELVLDNSDSIKQGEHFNIEIKQLDANNLEDSKIRLKLDGNMEVYTPDFLGENVKYDYDNKERVLELETSSLGDMVEIPLVALELGESNIELYQDGEKIDEKNISIENVEQMGISKESIDIAPMTETSDVTVLDPILREVIAKQLKKTSTPPTFTIAEMESLTMLSYAGTGKTEAEKIKSLAGLEYAKNLTDIVFLDNMIVDITPLSNLTKLDTINLSNNDIVNIKPLQYLNGLKWLSIYGNEIVDASPISNLTNITYMSIGFNKITDATSFENLVNLTTLGAASNQIIDVTPLKGLVNLGTLGLANNKITDITALNSLSKLTSLNISGNKIKDISGLSGIISRLTTFNASLQVIDLGNNKANGNLLSIINPFKTIEGTVPITTVSNGGTYNGANNTINWTNITGIQPLTFGFKDSKRSFDGTVSLTAEQTIYIPDPVLRKVINSKLGRGSVSEPQYFTKAELEQLTTLSYELETEKIKDLTGLEYAINLQVIGFKNQEISNLTPLKDLKKLENLDLSNNKIVNVDPLKTVTSLKSLILEKNQISNVSPLSSTLNLKVLSLNYNDISDISSLSSLVNLTNLEISNNKISDISAINKLTNLVGLTAERNQINNISALSSLTKLYSINICYNQISDISPLGNNIDIRQIYADVNNIENIDVVSKFNNLDVLDISYNKISDISPLANLQKISRLYIGGNRILDISVAGSTIDRLSTMGALGMYYQTVDLGTYKINGNKLSIKNPALTVGGYAPISIDTSNGYDGYNAVDNTLYWGNISTVENKSFDYIDNSRKFSGTASLTISRVGIKDPTNPNNDNPNPNPEGIPDLNHDLKLAINYIEPIDFGVKDIETRDMSIESVTKVPYIQLSDLRYNPTGWILKVKGSKLTETSGASIEGAKINMQNGEMKSSPSGIIDTPTLNQNLLIALDGTSTVNVAHASSGKGSGTWLGIWDTNKIDKKVTLEVPKGKARVGQYETTLSWELSDTP